MVQVGVSFADVDELHMCYKGRHLDGSKVWTCAAAGLELGLTRWELNSSTNVGETRRGP